MRPVILKMGCTLDDLRGRRGDFEDWFAAGFGWSPRQYAVIDARTATLPDPAGVDGVVVTGSPSAVHDHEAWSDRAGAWLRAAVLAEIPVLGVCYGHQLLGDAFGGVTGPNPNGREVGVHEVWVNEDDPLFSGLPPVFPVFQTHNDAVLEPPAAARVLAGNARTPVQAMAFGERARSVQWHPEFDADVMRGYLKGRAAQIDAEAGPGTAARLLAGVRDLPTGRLLLDNFKRFYLGAP